MSEHKALDSILRPNGITPLFQPVMRANGGDVAVHAVECLSRGPKGTNFESASVLFEYVRLKREESVVDRACISAALQQASRLPSGLSLCINVHASTLGRDAGFLPFLRATADRNGIALERVTVEVVEHAPPWDNSSFLGAIAALRATGARLAVDDIGLGQSNFKMLIDVGPDYLKLDRYFVTSCASDPKRRAVIAAVTHLAHDFGAEVIAEGIEDAETVATLQSHGVTLMQGFYFARPMSVDDLAAYVAAA